jgi:hypothetical protein
MQRLGFGFFLTASLATAVSACQGVPIQKRSCKPDYAHSLAVLIEPAGPDDSSNQEDMATATHIVARNVSPRDLTVPASLI